MKDRLRDIHGISSDSMTKFTLAFSVSVYAASVLIKVSIALIAALGW